MAKHSKTMDKKIWQAVEDRSEGLCEFPDCKCNYMVGKHHVYGGANRRKMEMKETVYNLCYYHHQDSATGVHFNKENRIVMRRIAIEALLNKGWTKEKILKEAGMWDGE